MNTIRLIQHQNHIDVEFHGSDLIPRTSYDRKPLGIQALIKDALEWCSRTPGEPKDVAATQAEPQDIPIEVGSKWSYMGMEPDTVIGVTDEEIITESSGRTSESGWSRKEFLTFHTRVCGPAGLDQLKAGFEP